MKTFSAGFMSVVSKRLRLRFGVPIALMAVLALALPAFASADPLGEIDEYKGGLRPIA